MKYEAFKPYVTLLSLMVMTSAGNVMAGQWDALHPAQNKDGLTQKTESMMFVPGFFYNPANHENKGFVLAPTGNGYNGRLYATANREPSAVLSNNPNTSNCGCPTGCPGTDADPILTATGTKVETYPLFALPGEMGLRFVLYYNGGRWSNNLNYSLDTQCNINPPEHGLCQNTVLYRPDGSVIHFNGGPTATTYSGGGVTTMTRDPSTGLYTLHDEDATTQVYSASGALQSIANPSGIRWTLSKANGLTTVTHTNGQSFTVKDVYASNVLTETVTDPAGNVYTVSGVGTYTLNAVTYPGSPTTVMGFKYVDFTAPPYSSRLSEVDYNGVPNTFTTYDMRDKVSGFTNPFYQRATGTYLADGSENVSITYGRDSTGNTIATVVNPLGHQVIKTFDVAGNVTLISGNAVQTCGATVSGRTYDSNNNLAAEIDNNGNTHTYSYANNGQLQTETEAAGTPIARTTDYVWDPDQRFNRPLSVTVRGWNKTTYTYTAQNRLASVVVANLSGIGVTNRRLTTTYAYALYPNGMVQTMTVTHPSPSGTDVDTFAYDALGNLTSQTNGLGQAVTYSNYNGLGLVGRVAGPNGDITDYTYDARGRVVTKTTHPGGAAAVWKYIYDEFGLLGKLISPDGQVTTWARDPSSMRVASSTHTDRGGTSTETYVYNANGDVLEHNLTRDGTAGLVEAFHYDALGHIYQQVGQHGQLLAYTYDGNGNTLSATNAIGHRVSYVYDALNRVTSKTEDDIPPVPAFAPVLNAPASSDSGSYVVSWGAVNGATTYPLQMQVNGGDWNSLQSTSDTTWLANGQQSGSYGYRAQACNSTGCGPWSITASTTVNVPPPPPQPTPIGMDGKTYEASTIIKTGSNSVGIGFYINNGTTWEVAKILPVNPHLVIDTGAVPGNAVSVQFTWIDAGVPVGFADAGGGITNPAATPVALSSSPATYYITGSFNANVGDHGHQYQLRVDFLDANGQNVSSSTCLLIADLTGNN